MVGGTTHAGRQDKSARGGVFSHFGRPQPLHRRNLAALLDDLVAQRRLPEAASVASQLLRSQDSRFSRPSDFTRGGSGALPHRHALEAALHLSLTLLTELRCSLGDNRALESQALAGQELALRSLLDFQGKTSLVREWVGQDIALALMEQVRKARASFSAVQHVPAVNAISPLRASTRRRSRSCGGPLR